MSRELIYTSAPQGILPGSRGFCTVAMSQGMPAPMRLGLEALTGYRAPSDDVAPSDAPVEYLHTMLDASGTRFHVVGAVRMAAPDHTGRSNSFAHFVVLERGELDANGPTALLRTDDVIRAQWNQPPQLLPPHHSLPPALHRGPTICSYWKEIAGDAGWAGALAGDFIIDSGRPTTIIVPNHIDVLRLADEAIALLPPEWRWRITFSTYWHRALPGISCAWRFVMDGTPEAATIRKAGNPRTMDVTRHKPCTRTGRYIEAARTGLLAIPEVESAISSDPQVRHQHRLREELEARGDLHADDVQHGQALAQHAPVDESSAHPARVVRDGGMGRSWNQEDSDDDQSVEEARRARTRSIIMIAAIVLAASVLSVIGTVLVLSAMEPEKEPEPPQVEPAIIVSPVAPAVEVPISTHAEPEHVATAATPALAADSVEAHDSLATTAPPPPPPPQPPPPPPPPPPRNYPLRFVAIVGDNGKRISTATIAPSDVTEIHLFGSQELIAVGVGVSNDGVTLRQGSSQFEVATLKRDADSLWIWEWTSSPLTDLSSLGGKEGIATGLWATATHPDGEETILFGPSTPTLIEIALGSPTSVYVPQWMTELAVIVEKADGTAVVQEWRSNQPMVIEWAVGSSTLSLNLERKGTDSEIHATITMQPALADVDEIKGLMSDAEACLRLFKRALAAVKEKRRPLEAEMRSLIQLLPEVAKQFNWKSTTKNQPPLLSKAQSEKLRGWVEEDGKAVPTIRTSEELFSAKPPWDATEETLFQDLVLFFEAVTMSCEKRIKEAKELVEMWPNDARVLLFDPSVCPNAERITQGKTASLIPGAFIQIKFLMKKREVGTER